MAGFIRRFGGRDATRVARTAIELACQQRDDLVPDQIVCDLLIPVAAAGGYIPGGFPATVPQAIRAAGLGAQLDLTLDAAVYLDVPEPVLVQRLPAWVRPDDTPEVIRHRLQVFTDTTSPLISYYRQDRGILVEVDAGQLPLSPLPPGSKLARTTCYAARSRAQWMIPPGPVSAAAVRFLTGHTSRRIRRRAPGRRRRHVAPRLCPGRR